MKDLSVLIPARNEMFLARTIEDLIQHCEADTEIIAVLDGAWADPPIPQHPMVNVVYLPESIGQRAATNLAARLAQGKYVAKVDAHCSFEQGFDRKMIEFFKEVGDDVVAVPIMRNLWAYDWKCYHCGWKKYQGPTPKECGQCGKSDKIRRKMMWVGKERPQSVSYCFDAEPHFQYGESYKHTQEYKMGVIVGYKLMIDFSPLSSDSLAQVMTNPLGGTKPSSITGIIELLTDLTRSHHFTVLPNSSRLWEDMTSNTMSFPSVDDGWGFGTQQINFIRDKAEMERIAALPILTDVVNYGYILASSTGNGTNQPSISETVCEGFLSELSTVTVTPLINSSLEDPTTRRTLHSDTLNKFNRVLGGEFIYSEIRKCFHNGSVALVPIYDKNYTETMSLQGSFFMASREKFWQWELSDEKLGNWGNQGIEVACAAWLSGGRVLVNHKTWYAHMFRTQGGDFGFPWENKGRETDKTKKNVKNKFWDFKHPTQIHPVSWLVEKFWPIPGWTENDLKSIMK